MTDDLIERVGEAISEARTGNSLSWRHYIAEAQAAIAAIEADRAELVADVFAYLIAKAQEPVEIFTGSFAKPLHADERTAWLEKMREEYNARYT